MCVMGRIIGVFLLGLYALVNSAVWIPAFAQSSAGDQIENVAYLNYTQNGYSVRRRTNAARFTIVPRPTDSEIRFYRYAPGFDSAKRVNLVETRYQPVGNDSVPFQPIGPFAPFQGADLDLSQPIPVAQVENYLGNDIAIVSVEDAGYNLNPNQAETLQLVLQPGTPSAVRLELTENGPNSSEFFGYIPIGTASDRGTGFSLNLTPGSRLTGASTDQYNATDVSSNLIFISGNGRIFDALSQAPINGAKVSIFNAETGAPAEVYGRDTIAQYPAEVFTGADVRDSAGELYTMQPGEFFFPFLKRGRYTVLVDPPANYVFPSLVSSPARPGEDTGSQKLSLDAKGLTFELTHNGALSIRVPVDPVTDVIVEKHVDRETAAIGDYVSYTVDVTNRGDSDSYVMLRDVAPKGFRIEEAFLQTASGAVPLAVNRRDGRTTDFDLGRLAVGETRQLVYVMQIVPGAQVGRQTNRIFLLDGRQNIASNVAQADIMVREDLLRTTGTITGSVSLGSCAPEADRKKSMPGLAGVQIYLETGDYVTTDTRGKFHFQNVLPGTHVVQIDDHTLPNGYELVLCEQTSRAAGSSRARFVELNGGTVQNVRFTAQKLAADPIQSTAPEIALHAQDQSPSETATHKGHAYDIGWLNQQDNSTSWIYPTEHDVLATPSLDLGIKHASNLRAELVLNGAEMIGNRQVDRLVSSDAQRVLSRWQNVDLQEGENRIDVALVSKSGQTVERLSRTLTYTAKIVQVEYLPTESLLVADGKTSPSIALKFMDAAGRAVHAGRIVGIDIAPPYRLYQENRLDETLGLTTSIAAGGGVTVGAGGIARVELDPTYLSGSVDLSVGLESGRIERISAFLSATQRPWIVVGLAEGSVGVGANPGTRNDDDPLLDDEDPYGDGRIALYARGTLGDDWNLTLGIDTDKRRGDEDSAFNLSVDPTASFTQYGDATYQQQAAPSRYPVYAKLERDQFQVTFGDFQTGLNRTELARYTRQLSGLYLTQTTDRYGLSVFAAETNQRFQRVEQAADGTSGPYTLQGGPIIVQSERIRIETRDRFRPDRILNTRTLIRYLEYDIDYASGEVIFSAPISASDSDFNPNLVVFEYESQRAIARDITAGGRGELRFLDADLVVGASVIQQGASGSNQTETDLLAGLDVAYRLNASTRLRAEYASTDLAEAAIPTDGPIQDALFVELNHQSRHGSVIAYLREQNTGFGLGQLTPATQDVRRYGVMASRQMTPKDNPETGERTLRALQLEAYNETNLSTDDNRSVGRLNFTQSSQSLSWDTGLTYAGEDYNDGTKRDSVLLTNGVRKHVSDAGLTLIARHEQPIGNTDDVAAFPQRTLLGLDKTLTQKATLNLRHEISKGPDISGQISRAGLTLTPWTGSNIRTDLERFSAQSRDQLAANFGLDQAFVIDEAWSAGLGFAQRFDLDSADTGLTPLPVSPLAPIGATASVSQYGSEAFQSGYAGLAYRTPAVFASARAEYRTDDTGARYTLAASTARQMSDALTFAGTLRYTHNAQDDAPDNDQIDARLGLAYRPDDDAFILYNRLDLRADKRVSQQENWKLINNLSAYKTVSNRTELGLFLGTKYAETTLLDQQYSGWTHLVGADLRRDIGQRWDIGVSGSALYAANSRTRDYGYGASLGYSPTKNIWLAAGYNFDGVKDDDFAASEFARSGPFIKLRMRFDEDTVEAALDRILRNNQ